MKEIFRLLKCDFIYIYKSKILIIGVILVSILCFVGIFKDIPEEEYKAFDTVMNEYGYSEEDINKLLDKPIVELNDKELFVRNSYELARSSINDYASNISGDRIFANNIDTICIYTIIFFVFIIGNDYHYKTINIFASKTKWGKRMICKVVSSWLFTIALLSVCYVVSNINGFILMNDLGSKVSNLFMDNLIIQDMYLIDHLKAALLITLFLGSIFALFTVIFKNRLYTLCLAIIYIMLPIIDIFDIRSIAYTILNNTMNRSYLSISFTPQGLDVNNCYTFVGSTIIMSFILIYYIGNKRSRFIE